MKINKSTKRQLTKIGNKLKTKEYFNEIYNSLHETKGININIDDWSTILKKIPIIRMSLNDFITLFKGIKERLGRLCEIRIELKSITNEVIVNYDFADEPENFPDTKYSKVYRFKMRGNYLFCYKITDSESGLQLVNTLIFEIGNFDIDIFRNRMK